MQFITDGPDIPDELLQAHEEGRVVFFCGAGISYPAGLQGFKWLVEKIYEGVGTVRNGIEEAAFKRGQFDVTLNLLEQSLPGGSIAVRRELEKVLKPKLRRKGATATHAALLKLARSREDALRLVTTNFDCLFREAAKRTKTKQKFQTHTAPMLPIPQNKLWDGLVYLHGWLPKKPSDMNLKELVLTSADFGKAYLTEGWAARFVSELFRNYSVCFVGYSINDPVMRYMMDALARTHSEPTHHVYAMGGYPPEKEEEARIEWKAKGVIPILYEDKDYHSLLHETLKEWAKIYSRGVQGKVGIVKELACKMSSGSTKQDDSRDTPRVSSVPRLACCP
ncbi:MAG: SIR2 family protein [Candidatus Endonucleobacter bathymodioli]|uniref:SIR2 family protein n=1 Tax=Candidatus Endonucleibacter bathymodioli TaxID=539814 RepID=A0AA90SLY1_9GAMM|nr:SIR2 family protein [Candidatus Endonucleobacter bathymodioli]